MLKPGIGRLICTREDTGIIVILDPRVRTKAHGRMFLDALPDCRVVIENKAATGSAWSPSHKEEVRARVFGTPVGNGPVSDCPIFDLSIRVKPPRNVG